jgi:hypothetical protein
MAILRLQTDGSASWFKPRSTVAGDASWHLDTAAEAIEVRLFFYTQGKGTQDVQIVDSLRIERPEPSGHTRFSFALPSGPYSFSGQLITLNWALELVAVPGEDTHRIELLVGPRPVEISIRGLREY